MAQLLVVNRRRRKRRATAARGAHGRFVKRHRARRTNRRRRRHVARRRRSRSRSLPVVRVNRRRRRHVARRSHGRRRRHNPRLLGSFKPREIAGKLTSAAIGAGGGLALDVLLNKVQASLPASLQSGWAFTAVKVAGALGLGWGAGRVLGQEKGRLVTYGALTIIAYGVLKKLIIDNAPQFASSIGLSAYMNDYTAYPSLGYTDPAPRLAAYMQPGSNMSAYMPGGPDQVSGFPDGM